MEELELWHVFIDNGTGRRFCQYGYRDALTFNIDGCFMKVSEGKTELPLEEWSDEELLWAAAGILKAGKRDRLANLPGIILQAMKECGGPDAERAAVMRETLYEVQKNM